MTDRPARAMWCEHAVLDGRVHHGVTVAIADGRITSVTTDTDPHGAPRRVGLTIPGLANAHSHAFQRALRGRTHDGRGDFWSWREQMYHASQTLHPDSMYRVALATFAEMVCAGVTCVGEFHYVHHQPDGTPYDDPNAMGHAVLAAAADAGIRITLLDTLYLHGGLDATGYRPLAAEQRRFGDASADAWIARVAGLSPGTGQQIGAAVHSVRAVDPAAIAAAAAWSVAAGGVLHAHLSEQQAENQACAAAHGCTPTALLQRHHALGPQTTVVHATHLTGQDLAVLGATATRVCLCPSTEADLADGIAPTAALLDAGVELSLGSDSQARIDLLAEAGDVELDQRRSTGRRGTVGPAALLAMAAEHGHRSLGWDDAGRIAAGCRADLVTLSLGSRRTAGAPASVATAVFVAGAGDVTHVTVDGTDVVVDGRHVSLDVAAELAAAITEVGDR